jgi:hypothetical protein
MLRRSWLLVTYQVPIAFSPRNLPLKPDRASVSDRDSSGCQVAERGDRLPGTCLAIVIESALTMFVLLNITNARP